MKNTICGICLMTLCLFIILPDNGKCIEIEKKNKSVFGIKYGSFGEGAIKVDDIEYDTDDGKCFGIFFDYPVISKLYGTASIDIAELKFFKDNEHLLNPSLGIKWNFITKDKRIAFRPCFSVGYGILNSIGDLKSSEYITTRLYGEFITYLSGKVGIIMELGFFWAPSGGDGIHDITTAGSIFVYRFGIVF